MLECDANAKVGSSVIKGDPNDRSPNGVLLMDLIFRQNLEILNISEKPIFGTIIMRPETDFYKISIDGNTV